MNRKNNNKKKRISENLPDGENTKTMFLEQVVSLKIFLGWGATIILAVATASYHVGKWVKETDDKFVFHRQQVELNETRTRLTLEFNERVTKLERENARLETLLEICQGKEVSNGK